MPPCTPMCTHTRENKSVMECTQISDGYVYHLAWVFYSIDTKQGISIIKQALHMHCFGQINNAVQKCAHLCKNSQTLIIKSNDQIQDLTILCHPQTKKVMEIFMLKMTKQ